MTRQTKGNAYVTPQPTEEAHFPGSTLSRFHAAVVGLLSVGILGGTFSASGTQIEIFPAELAITANGESTQIVVSEIGTDGLRRDRTNEVRFEFPKQNLALSDNHQIRGLESGEGTLQAHLGETRLTIPFRVTADPVEHPPSFVKDILPILSRSGCNGGSCHAKPNGQNSFQLSVFAFDPESDYHEIVRDARGRRLFPGLPEASLLLQKPTLAVPHKGGKRLEPGSPFYQTIVDWIQAGAPYQQPDEASLEAVLIEPGSGRFPPKTSHALRVTARYADGSLRDVTSMVEYASSDKELITVDESGHIRTAEQSGEAVILARYMGHVGQLRVTVPSTTVDTTDVAANFPRNNFIDEFAAKQFQRLGLIPSPTCDDATFLRRATLDAVGRLPTIAEARAFLADKAPDKRSRWAREIVKDRYYADYWANQWADLLRPNPDRVGIKSVYLLDRWLRECFQENMPYDKFARAIMEHEGSNHGVGPAVIYRDRRIPTELTSLFSQVFLGVRMECAKCHHHPFEKWSQGDFYQFAAYFGSVRQKGAGLSPPISAGTESFYYTAGGKVKHPITDQIMSPKAPDGPQLEKASDDPRQQLGEWLIQTTNPYFARAVVNRVWATFFSRGFVNPVDDFRDSNPPVNEPLLEAVAQQFIAHDFDLKWLMATLMESALYQTQTEPNESNLRDTKNFSRFYRHRLPAEVLLDAVCQITEVPETFGGLPPDSRAMEAWTYKIGSHFLDAFGRPNSSSDPPCERDDRGSVVQALHLMHSEDLDKKISHTDGRARALADSDRSNTEIVETLYLACFSRFPTDEEREIAEAILPAEPKERREAVEDLMWALLNTAEFIFNH